MLRIDQAILFERQHHRPALRAGTHQRGPQRHARMIGMRGGGDMRTPGRPRLPAAAAAAARQGLPQGVHVQGATVPRACTGIVLLSHRPISPLAIIIRHVELKTWARL